ncbi:MAG: DNA repair protein RecO [Deltaproteobacteria bacterium]|nr:DNA repair protein RecO [Deltaproteobacteria bacterium]
MAADVRYQGVVVKKVAYRDSDLVLGIFTKEDGKISVFVPGARKSTKRFGPYLDLFAEVHLVASQHPQQSLLRLKETELVSPHMNVRKNLTSLGFVTYYAECLWNLLADHDPHVDIYTHMVSMMDQVHADKDNFQKLLTYEFQLLTMCGYRPGFQQCGDCKQAVVERAFFSFTKGNVICRECHHTDHGIFISDKTMQHLQRKQPWDAYSYAEMRDLMASFVSYTIGKDLKSHVFRRATTRSLHVPHHN